MMKRLFLWQNLQGEKQVIVAKSMSEAKQLLLQQQVLFFKIKRKGYITNRSFSRHELIIITKLLSTMLKAGLPIFETLELLANDHPMMQWKWLLTEIKHQIMKGNTISEALEPYPHIFPQIYKEIVATGELTGQLENSFERLAIQLEKMQKLNKQIKKALRYPLFLLITSSLVTLIMLLIVLPKFSEVYQSFDAELPYFTQVMITLSDILQRYFVYLMSFSLLSFGVYRIYLKKHYIHKIETLLFNTPVLGNIIITSNLAQIFQTLAITQKSGIPILSALLSAKKTAYHQLFCDALFQIGHEIEQGHAFSFAIQKYSIFPNLCFQLIRVGEESGTLDIMLEKLAEYYQQQSEELTSHLSAKIEPIMMSLMAIIIGSLVIAMYLPVFQLGNVIH